MIKVLLLNKKSFFYVIILSLIFCSCGTDKNNDIKLAITANDVQKVNQLVVGQLDTSYKDGDGKTLLELAKNTKNDDMINAIEFGLNYNVIKELEGKWRLDDGNNRKYTFYLHFKIDKEKFIFLKQLYFEPKPQGIDVLLEMYMGWSKIRFKDSKCTSYTYFMGDLAMISTFEKIDGKWYAFLIDKAERKPRAKKYAMIKI